MKQPITCKKFSPQWFQNYIALRQLAFERSMDRGDYHAANIACAQKQWAEMRLADMTETNEDGRAIQKTIKYKKETK